MILVVFGVALRFPEMGVLGLLTVVLPATVILVVAADRQVTLHPLGRVRTLELMRDPEEGGVTVQLDGRPGPPIDAVELYVWRWSAMGSDGTSVGRDETAFLAIWCGPHLWSTADLSPAMAKSLAGDVSRWTGVAPTVRRRSHLEPLLRIVTWVMVGIFGLVGLALYGLPVWVGAAWGLALALVGFPVALADKRRMLLGGRAQLNEPVPRSGVDVGVDRVELECARGSGLPSVTILTSGVGGLVLIAAITGGVVGWIAVASLLVTGWAGARWLSAPLSVVVDAYGLTVGRRRVLWEDLHQIDVAPESVRWQRLDGRSGSVGSLVLSQEQVTLLRTLTQHLVGRRHGVASTEARAQLSELLSHTGKHGV
ncbi:MAG: hypothetical protein KTR31_02890 [Myxococcales bacterium]|nr:hypothetical protein [Myxococcales bacterium]